MCTITPCRSQGLRSPTHIRQVVSIEPRRRSDYSRASWSMQDTQRFPIDLVGPLPLLVLDPEVVPDREHLLAHPVLRPVIPTASAQQPHRKSPRSRERILGQPRSTRPSAAGSPSLGNTVASGLSHLGQRASYVGCCGSRWTMPRTTSMPATRRPTSTRAVNQSRASCGATSTSTRIATAAMP